MFNKIQIEDLRKELKIRDPGIFEKTVRVFSLLEGLLKVYKVIYGSKSTLLPRMTMKKWKISPLAREIA